jgi:pyruvate dehydrogenase E1 component beta subunit
VPEEDYTIDIGKANIRKNGNDVTIIAWSKMVLESLEAANILSDEGIEAEIIDLRSLVPLDEATIFESVKKTNRAVVVQEAWKNSGFGAEVASRIQENVFDYLDGPVIRVAGLDTPVPFSPELERTVVPTAEQIAIGAKSLW